MTRPSRTSSTESGESVKRPWPRRERQRSAAGRSRRKRSGDRSRGHGDRRSPRRAARSPRDRRHLDPRRPAQPVPRHSLLVSFRGLRAPSPGPRRNRARGGAGGGEGEEASRGRGRPGSPARSPRPRWAERSPNSGRSLNSGRSPNRGRPRNGEKSARARVAPRDVPAITEGGARNTGGRSQELKGPLVMRGRRNAQRRPGPLRNVRSPREAATGIGAALAAGAVGEAGPQGGDAVRTGAEATHRPQPASSEPSRTIAAEENEGPGARHRGLSIQGRGRRTRKGALRSGR